LVALESLKDLVCERFVHVGIGYSVGLRWRAIAVFESRILTSAVINSKHIKPRQFFEDAREIVLDCVRDVLQKCNTLKINTVFNGEFVEGEKMRIKVLLQEIALLFD